jgi:two-component system CheB/CheR fusion protein
VTVKSLVGIGTTFSIHIPAECVVNSATTTQDEGGRNSLKGKSILLVEDHEVARTTTAQLLEAEGASVQTAETGREAIRLLATGQHDVLLLDLNLPDFDGTEILKSLQQAKPARLHCLLVVSGDVRPERIAEVKELGAHDLLPKPVSIERIGKALEKCGVKG